MVEPIKDSTVHPFTVWWMDENGDKRMNIGGSYDEASAVAIMGACLIALQAIEGYAAVLLEVFDSSDTPIAFIGRLPGG